jgi:ubiquinone biosynthesis protein
MVVTEGVARSLDPKLNIWVAAEPVVRDWMARELGPAAKLRAAAVNVAGLANALSEAPKLIERGTKLVEQLSTVGDEDATAREGALRVQAKSGGSLLVPLWIAAVALVIIAIRLLIG